MKGPRAKKVCEQLQRELNTHQRLKHKNIISFFDSWEYQGKIVLITELAVSGTLKQ